MFILHMLVGSFINIIMGQKKKYAIAIDVKCYNPMK